MAKKKKKNKRVIMSTACRECGSAILYVAKSEQQPVWDLCPECGSKVVRSTIYAVALRAAMLSSELQYAAEQLQRAEPGDTLTRLEQVRKGLDMLSRDSAVTGWHM